MSMITWDDGFSVQVQEFDTHHKKLVNLINELHEAMKVGRSKEILSGILKQLIDYTGFHFGAEEKNMMKYNYAGYKQHKVEHEKFVNKVLQFQSEYEAGKLLITMELMTFLKDWLLNHIKKSDKDYGPFFNEKGIK